MVFASSRLSANLKICEKLNCYKVLEVMDPGLKGFRAMLFSKSTKNIFKNTKSKDTALA